MPTHTGLCAAQRASWLAALLMVAQPAAATTEDDCPIWFPDFRCEREARPPGSSLPMSFPFYFEDPYITSGINFIGIWHDYPATVASTPPLPWGGQIGALALQIRLAITDRLAFIATKDGVGFHDPASLPDATGAFNLALGFKYALWKTAGENWSAIVTPSLRYEIPIPQGQIFQGGDPGVFIPAIATGFQHGNWHLIGSFGGFAPISGQLSSSNFFYNFRVDHAFPVGRESWWITHIAPFIELNGIHWITSGDGSRTIRVGGTVDTVANLLPPGFEGVDVVNLGNPGVAGNDYVTMAWGVRIPFRTGLNLGFAYERPLSNTRDITEQRVTVNATFEF